MRTVVDIPDEQLKRLDIEAKRQGISRAESVRRAVEKYLQKQTEDGDGIRASFGAWKDKDMPDSVEYVRQLRDEWER